MTSPDDQLDGIFSQIAAQDQVDPAVFDQTLETAFDYTGDGFDELIPDSDSSSTDTDGDVDGDALLVGDLDDAFYEADDSDNDDAGDTADVEHTDHTDHSPIDHHTDGDDLFT